MGSPNAFEFRRAELQDLKAAEGSGETASSDEEVVKSYLDLVEPDSGSERRL